MPLTVEQAIAQVKAKIQEKGKFSVGNMFDGIIGVISDNAADLQAMLDKLLTKKGVLTEADEKALQELVAKQDEEKKKRQRRRSNTFLLIASVAATFTAIYFIAHKKK